MFTLHRHALRVLLHDRAKRLMRNSAARAHPAWNGCVFTSSIAAEKAFDAQQTSPIFCGLAGGVTHDSAEAARFSSRCQFCGLPIPVRSKSHHATMTGKRRGIVRHPLIHRSCSESITSSLRHLWKEVRYNLPRPVENALSALKAAARESKAGHSRGTLSLDYEVRGKLLGLDRCVGASACGSGFALGSVSYRCFGRAIVPPSSMRAVHGDATVPIVGITWRHCC